MYETTMLGLEQYPQKRDRDADQGQENSDSNDTNGVAYAYNIQSQPNHFEPPSLFPPPPWAQHGFPPGLGPMPGFQNGFMPMPPAGMPFPPNGMPFPPPGMPMHPPGMHMTNGDADVAERNGFQEMNDQKNVTNDVINRAGNDVIPPQMKANSVRDNKSVSPPPSRERFSYTRYQIEVLNGIFTGIRYPNSMQKQLVAKRVGITRDQVKVWFQNRRRKDVVGKSTQKDDYLQLSTRKMVPDDVMKSVLSELFAFENDPKGKRVKEALTKTFENKKQAARHRREDASSPASLSSGDSPAPSESSSTMNSDVFDSMFHSQDGYQPNAKHFEPRTDFSLAAFAPTATNGEDYRRLSDSMSSVPLPTSGQRVALPVSLEQESQPPQSMAIHSNENVSKSVTRLTAVSGDIYSNVSPVTSCSSSDDSNDGLHPQSHNIDSGIDRAVTHQNTVTPVCSGLPQTLNNISSSEDSNESFYGTSSEKSSDLSSHLNGSAACTNKVLSHSDRNSTSSEDFNHSLALERISRMETVAPPNKVVAFGGAPRPLKRSRSVESITDEEQEEPPRKRPERLAESSDDVTPPPNKVAPPSEPLKFDFKKEFSKPPTTTPLTVVIPKTHNSSPVDERSQMFQPGGSAPMLMAPLPMMPDPISWPTHQWPIRSGDSQLPTPGFPGLPPGIDLSQYARDGLYLPTALKPPAPLEFSGNLKDMFPFPQSGPYPWDLSSNNNYSSESEKYTEKAPMSSLVQLSADGGKMSSLNDNYMRLPHASMGRQDVPAWPLGPYPSPYCSFGPGPVSSLGDGRVFSQQ